MADLIDRTELRAWLTSATGFRANCEDCTSANCVDCIVFEAIDNAPTEDAAPVVYGKAVAIEPYLVEVDRKCAACGTAMTSDDNYCHNCGAKMDGV